MSLKRTIVTALALAAIPVPAAQAYHLEDQAVAPQAVAPAADLRSADARDHGMPSSPDVVPAEGQRAADTPSGGFPWQTALIAGLGVTLVGATALALRHRDRVAPTT